MKLQVNPKYDGYQRGLAWMVCSFLVKNQKLNKINNLQMNFINQLLENLNEEEFVFHLQAIFRGGGVDLADMQLISKDNKGIRYVLCAIDVFSKYVWVVPIKDKKGVIIVNAFQKILDSLERKPNKIWVDKVVNFTTILLKNG